VRACRKYRGEESCKRVLEGKPGGKRPLKCPRHRLEDNIKMDIQVVSWGGGAMDWFDLAQDRYSWLEFVKVAKNLQGSMKCGEKPD